MENNEEIKEETIGTQDGQAVKQKKGFKSRLNSFFKISERGSSVTVEVFAGLTTFLSMCYILAVCPMQILGQLSPDDPAQASLALALKPSVFIATALCAVIGTTMMALFAKMPLAQASGLGISAMVGGMIGASAEQVYGVKFSFGNAMAISLLSGLVFLALTVIPCGRDKETGRLIGIREKIFDGIPSSLKAAIPVGIGLFIAFIGMQKANLIVNNDYTLVGLVSFNGWKLSEYPAKGAIVCLISLLAIGIMSHYKVKGSVMLGILIATIVAIPLGVADTSILSDGESWKFWNNFKNFFSMDKNKGGSFLAAFTGGFAFPKGSYFTVIMLIISFCMLDLFDTMGTVLGCCSKAGLLDANGKPQNYKKIMLSEACATCTGALFGVSTVATFVESGTGIASGGKTGLTALTVSGMFLISIFLLPLFSFIPSAAAAGALIYVGVLMMSNVRSVDFTDVRMAVPAFITIVMMPLTYSITGGIGLGIISYVVINSICYLIEIVKYTVIFKKGGEAVKPVWSVSLITVIITVFFLVYFFVPTTI